MTSLSLLASRQMSPTAACQVAWTLGRRFADSSTVSPVSAARVRRYHHLGCVGMGHFKGRGYCLHGWVLVDDSDSYSFVNRLAYLICPLDLGFPQIC